MGALYSVAPVIYIPLIYRVALTMPQVKSEEVTLSKDLSLIDVGTRVMAPRSRGERQVAEIKNPGIPQDSQDSIGGSNPATSESKVEGRV